MTFYVINPRWLRYVYDEEDIFYIYDGGGIAAPPGAGEPDRL